MPCFNAQASVARAVNSIQQQTLSNWELIVVDDGSQDESAKIVEEIAAKDHRIQVITKALLARLMQDLKPHRESSLPAWMLMMFHCQCV